MKNKKHTYSVRLPHHIVDAIKAIGNGSLSKGVYVLCGTEEAKTLIKLSKESLIKKYKAQIAALEQLETL